MEGVLFISEFSIQVKNTLRGLSCRINAISIHVLSFAKPADSSTAVFFPGKDIAMGMFVKELTFFLVETRDYF